GGGGAGHGATLGDVRRVLGHCLMRAMGPLCVLGDHGVRRRAGRAARCPAGPVPRWPAGPAPHPGARPRDTWYAPAPPLSGRLWVPAVAVGSGSIAPTVVVTSASQEGRR